MGFLRWRLIVRLEPEKGVLIFFIFFFAGRLEDHVHRVLSHDRRTLEGLDDTAWS